MFHHRFKLITILSSLFFALIGINTQAQAMTTYVITTPAPVAKEVIVVPRGYNQCFMTRARWYNGMWIPSHRVCKYRNSPNQMRYPGAVWVDGYWSCTKHTRGVCARWKWKKGHWVKSADVFY